MMFYRFHVNLFAKPATGEVADAIELRGATRRIIRSAGWSEFLPVTFEQAVAALAALPRMDVEPDGFFVISGDDEVARWQVDGHLFDYGDRVHRVELRGECPPAMFDDLLHCFGWPETPLAFELVREGVAMEETAFREWAAGG